jgi:hypothetical protein
MKRSPVTQTWTANDDVIFGPTAKTTLGGVPMRTFLVNRTWIVRDVAVTQMAGMNPVDGQTRTSRPSPRRTRRGAGGPELMTNKTLGRAGRAMRIVPASVTSWLPVRELLPPPSVSHQDPEMKRTARKIKRSRDVAGVL